MTMLRRHRLAKGLTGAKLAARIGVSPAAVSSWENGRQLPHAAVIPTLARVLGLDPVELTKLLSPERTPAIAAAG
jgi:transcriptional regulator with XRE-family HTH domain